MHQTTHRDDASVRLTDSHPTATAPERATTEAVARQNDVMRDLAAADALVAQAPVRAAVAIIGSVVQLAIMLALPGHGDARAFSVVLAAYLLALGAITAWVRFRRSASTVIVTTALLQDLAFIYAGTALSTSPAHYERSLFGAMVVIHVANFYFGRRQAWRLFAAAAAGYLALILRAKVQSLPIECVEELWTLGIGAMGTTLVIAQAGHVRRRLRTIVTLFERAEQGDFTHTYDEAADQRHDAITRVGRAYNRVRAQLSSMVLGDPLTGCLNRRGFEQALTREISRASRAGTELALLVLDLDHFKLVNDTYGHPAGDEVLRTTGRLLLQTARVGDIVARVGGEEFAILLPATRADGALHFAQRLCDIVRAHSVSVVLNAQPIRVTTSIGVASVAPRNTRDSAGDATVLARHADIALYAAKRSGRDQARPWDSELEILPRTSDPRALDDAAPLGLA
jgi:diguanylate cyclase (GGDEF)-like protein